MIYLGNGKVANCITAGVAISDVDFTTVDKWNGYGFVARITQETAESIDDSNCNKMFNVVTGRTNANDYGLYWGTTEGSYTGSYNIGQWLFDKLTGFLDYLVGVLTYIIRLPFLAFVNMVEDLVNDSINDISGIKTEVIGAENNETTTDTTNSEDGEIYIPSATTTKSNNKIDVEDIIFNRLPILDVNIFDVDLTRYKEMEEAQRLIALEGDEIEVISEDSVVYSLRQNIAKWYMIIRRICIITLLILLLYLGIRLAISTTSGDKAKYKGMLMAWLTSFIVIFCIHYYMMAVIEINELLVDIFAENMQEKIEWETDGVTSASLYDTVRTKAYSLKLSEGIPATIFYMVLVYFLIRFLYVYIKRYFTICILALMGPIMALKNCFDKISKGKSKSMSKWMYDFALNVFLQLLHSIIYSIFMLVSFTLAMQSIPGFVVSLIMLNFIFKAEKIFMQVFQFEGRASSLRDVNENKNYISDIYKTGIGAIMFGKSAVKYTAGAAIGTGKYVGQSVLAGTQLGVSAFNRVSWAIGNRRAKRQGNDPIEYKPVDIQEKLKEKMNNTKEGVADKINDKIYNLTGSRNLRLDLHNIKKKDPIMYEQTKQLLKLKKKQKYKTLKRTFNDSKKSIRYMSQLMMGVPMAIIDTKYGMSMLINSVDGLRDMSRRDKKYGYKRKTDKQNIGEKALNVATLGTYNATRNSVEKLEKELKKTKDYEAITQELEKANILQNDIQKRVEEMIKEGKKDEAKKSINNALDSVVLSKKIKEIISAYMAQKGIKNVNEADLNMITNELNREIFNDKVRKAVNDYMNSSKKDELDSSDIDKILSNIDEKISRGALGVMNNNRIEKNNEIIKQEIDKVKKDNKSDNLSKEQLIDVLTSQESVNNFAIDAKDELRQNIKDQFNQYSNNNNKGLDKKQATSAIEDAILHTTAPEENQLVHNMRELKTIQEKIKGRYGKNYMNTGFFVKELKEKMR